MLAEVNIDRAALIKELRNRSDIEQAYIEVIPQMAGNANLFLRGMRTLVAHQCVGAIDVLVPFTDDENDTIRKYATSAFEQLRAIYATVTEDDIETRVSWLVKGLDEGEREVEEIARETLLDMGKEAVPALLNSLSYTNNKERIKVLYILREIDYYDDSVFEALNALLYVDNYQLIYAVLGTMKELMGNFKYSQFHKEYEKTLKPHHDELKAALHTKLNLNAAERKEREIYGWVRQLTAPDARSRVDAQRELAFMPAADRKIAERLINEFDESTGYGYHMEKDHNIKRINWDFDKIFESLTPPKLSPESKKLMEFLMGNLQQSKDGIARAEAANDLVKKGNVAVYYLVRALKDSPRPHDVVTTLNRIDPFYGRRAKQWLQQQKNS